MTCMCRPNNLPYQRCCSCKGLKSHHNCWCDFGHRLSKEELQKIFEENGIGPNYHPEGNVIDIMAGWCSYLTGKEAEEEVEKTKRFTEKVFYFVFLPIALGSLFLAGCIHITSGNSGTKTIDNITVKGTVEEAYTKFMNEGYVVDDGYNRVHYAYFLKIRCEDGVVVTLLKTNPELTSQLTGANSPDKITLHCRDEIVRGEVQRHVISIDIPDRDVIKVD